MALDVGSTREAGQTMKLCRIPFCKWERLYKKYGRRAQLHGPEISFDRWSAGEECDGKFTWRHFGKHLICEKCGADGT